MEPMSRTSDRSDRSALSRVRGALRHVRVLLAIAVVVPLLPLLAPSSRSEAVVNGSPVGSAPSWAAILVGLSKGSGTNTCSGVLVASNLVLSAKHCGKVTSTSGAAVGRSNALNTSTGTAALTTTRFAHPDQDIALYKLDKAVSAAPARIGSDDPSRGAPSLVPLTLYGYGRITELTQKAVLDFKLRTAVGLVASCGGTAPQFCLKPQSIQGPCPGDSGGALVASGKLIGIYNGNRYDERGQLRCVGNTWGATSVTAPEVRDWINGIIISNPASS